MTPSDSRTHEPVGDEPAGSAFIETIRRRPAVLWIVLVGLAFVVATFSFWSSDGLILDDYVACGTTERLGIIGMAKWYFFDFVGLYRPVTVPMLSSTAALCEVPVALKAIGLAFHLTAGWLAFRLARNGLGWHRASAAVASLAILFSPVAMAGSGWVAAARGYAFALVLILWFTLRLVQGKRDWRTILLGTLTVMTQEQTLFVVLLLPFILTPGTFWRRTRYTAISGLPIATYFAILLVSPILLAGAYRIGSENGASVSNVFDNYRAWSDQLVPYLPFGGAWNSLASGPFTPIVWIALALITAAIVLLLASSDRSTLRASDAEDRQQHRAAVHSVAIAVAALAAALLFVLPLLLAPTAWASPRLIYLPLAAIAFVIAGLTEAAILISGRMSLVVGAVLVVGWALLVVPGVVRDASALAYTSSQEQAIADEIETAALAKDATIVIMNGPPWSLAPNGTATGDHLVHAFAVYWSAPSALQVLTDLEADRVLVVRDSSVCADPGFVTDTATGERWETRTVVVYDFGRRSIVPDAEVTSILSECAAS